MRPQCEATVCTDVRSPASRLCTPMPRDLPLTGVPGITEALWNPVTSAHLDVKEGLCTFGEYPQRTVK